MSFEPDGSSARQPRSLTLTFAETHPWERLVRDRLNALPRGYLKRFVLLLIEKAELDLSSDESFRHQVEQALLQRELPAGRPVTKTVVHADSVRVEPSAREIISAASRVPSPQRRPDPLPPSSPRSNDPGFGALEL